MPKLPNPPSAEEMRWRGADFTRLDAGTLLFRIYFRGGEHPTGWNEFRAFGPLAASRFDHHPEPRGSGPGSHEGFGILYAASLVKTCVAEVFQDGRVVDRRRREPWLVGFEIEGPLDLLDLTGNWPTRMGASMTINSGPRPSARQWSRTIHEAYPRAAGLLYASSMNANERAVALYERCRAALPPRPAIHVPLSHPGLRVELDRVADELGYALVL